MSRRRRRRDPRKTFEADMAERIASGDKEAVKRLERIGRRQGYIDPPEERDQRHGGINEEIRAAARGRVIPPAPVSPGHAAINDSIRGKTWGKGDESGGNKFGPYGPGSSWQGTRTGEVELP